MSRPTFKAELNALGRGKVSIDGHDISNMINAFSIESKVGDATQIHLSLIAPELDLELVIDGVRVVYSERKESSE